MLVVLTCSSFSILEFFLYFVGIDVHSIVPRSDALADALIGGSILAVAILSLLSPQFLLFFLFLWAQ